LSSVLPTPGLERRLPQVEKGLSALALVLLAVVLSMPLPFAPEMFPSIKRFAPIIRSQGNCDDRILFVEGEYPYSTRVDYRIELRFYGGREMELVSCEGLAARARDPQSSWILMAGGNRERCLDTVTRAAFPQ
jgi:hypothetical protein